MGINWQPLTQKQRKIVDEIGWASAGVSLDFALDRLNCLEDTIQDAVLKVDAMTRFLGRTEPKSSELAKSLDLLRKTLTDALGS